MVSTTFKKSRRSPPIGVCLISSMAGSLLRPKGKPSTLDHSFCACAWSGCLQNSAPREHERMNQLREVTTRPGFVKAERVRLFVLGTAVRAEENIEVRRRVSEIVNRSI